MPLELRPQITQKIKARVKLLNYKPNSVSGVDDGSYSVYSLIGQSKVNKPYVFELTFVSDKSINIEDISDTDVHVILEDMVDNKIVKDIFGKIYSVSEDSVVANKYMYKIKIVNPMYYLGFTNKYEIFHNKKSIDIISEIIRRYSSILNVRLDLKIDNQNTPIQEYTTQYDQSDLDFILMLCQKEGYSLIFDYSCNDPYVLTLCELNEHVINNKYPSTASYNHSKTFQSSFFVQDFYDKDKPSLEYVVKSGANITSSIKDNSSTKQLRTDIQREKFRDKLNLLNESFFKDLNRYTKIDSLSQYVKSNEILGTSLELHLKDSMCVTLDDEDANKSIDVIILEVNYKGYFPNALDEYASHESQIQYEINFTSIPKDIIYKPPLTIIKPKIYGIQTAIVSNSNPNTKDYINTIDTDELGRVKVLFHFERNQTTSCYLRVSNISSGTQYGTQFIPRVNSEVIVSFVNGDPDYPIIIGTLHNGENVNPYPLPNNKTQSFIKTYSIPQYEDKQGYNEILFEDKRGAEQLNLRAQKDMNTLVLNDKNQNVKNNENVLIEANKNETIKKDSTLTVGKNYTQNIKENQITTVDVDKIVSVKGDCEIGVMKNKNIIVRKNKKSIFDKNTTQRVKNTKIAIVQKDVKEKYSKNQFLQVLKDYKLDVQKNFHLKVNHLKQKANKIELIASNTISLKCSSNVLSLDNAGVHFHSSVVDKTSSNVGLFAKDVLKPNISKPLYEKIRVVKIQTNILKQNSIEDMLNFTAIVEKYENDSWNISTNLNETQLSQLQWYFIKNNDQLDKDINIDRVIKDTLIKNGLTMSVKLQSDNVDKFAHVHCFAVSSDDEGYAQVELKRDVQIINVNSKYSSQDEGELEAVLNIEKPRNDELEQIRWNVENRPISKYNGKTKIKHKLKEEKVNEINFKAFVKGKDMNGVEAMMAFDEDEKQLTNLEFEK